jgi:hypothetical protein
MLLGRALLCKLLDVGAALSAEPVLESQEWSFDENVENGGTRHGQQHEYRLNEQKVGQGWRPGRAEHAKRPHQG